MIGRGKSAVGMSVAGISVAAVCVMAGTARGQSDSCAGAVPLPMGVAVASMSGATEDGADVCRSGVGDVWYTFTAARDGVLFLDACPTNNGTPGISVHTGCPGNVSNLIACNFDDSYHCGFRPHLEITCVAGATYKVRVAGGRATYSLATWFEDPKPVAGVGPDVVSGDIPEMQRYADSGEWAALAYGSTACNIGTEQAIWTNQNGSNQHPVISTSLYRISNGVLEQLGYAWLKHGWASGTETFCDYCPATGVLPVLLPGCSDSYDVPQNGTQQILGARSEVDPTTGIFPYPPVRNPGIADSTSRRIRVRVSDLDTGGDSRGVHLAELQYVAADDALAGNAMNNVSYRPIRFDTQFSQPRFLGPIVRTKPAILGWADHDPSVAVVPVDVVERGYLTRFWVASKVWEVEPGRWRYVYAVFNLNSNRACGGLVMTQHAGVGFHSVAMRFPESHSGDIYLNETWPFVRGSEAAGAGSMGFRVGHRHDVVPNANAIRWGLTYTYMFDTFTPPTTGAARLELFGPGEGGSPSWASVSLPVPSAGACIADFNGDGFVDFFDYGLFVEAFEEGGDLAGPASDLNGDGFVDFFDYDAFLAVFEAGC